MTNWKTNLGGAISIAGSSLLGVGLLVSPGTMSPTELKRFILAGLICSALGKSLTALFAADAAAVQSVAKAVDKINQEGPSTEAPPAISKPEPKV